eukprot:TRINITY_DN19680_c0_g1_i1.p1 TRINITY_DN19680_c0_g1~~TRINITY_DN19680_c0_g1_i1.p1  ORF type:complete len:376 (-),score=93.91 TRINITY_DN19680_c0_g1_i1:34-1104(-)
MCIRDRALSELAKEGMIEETQIRDIIQDLISFKEKPVAINIQEPPKNFMSEKQKKKHEEKMVRKEKMLGRMVRQKPVYENCTLLAPDGEILCKCDREKMEWYLKKGLGKSIDNDTVQLLFEPNTRRWQEMTDKDHKYYISAKVNQCVVCGNEKEFMKYHIVPILYRQYFPHGYKSHRSHDVVLLCLRCHEKANREADKRRFQLSEQYQVPIHIPTKGQIMWQQISYLGKLLVTLKRNRETLPGDRCEELLDNITKAADLLNEQEEFINTFGKLEYTKDEQGRIVVKEDLYKSLEEIKKKKKENTTNRDFRTLHGQYLMEKVTNVEQFIRDWREHFVQTMHPPVSYTHLTLPTIYSV